MPQYTADQVIGKTLFAKKQIPVKRIPTDSAPVVYNIEPGKNVGVVYSWLGPGPLRTDFYWMFYDASGRPFYTVHKPGMYSESDIREQGAITIKEQVEAAKAANETTKEFIGRMLKLGIFTFAAVVIVKGFIQKK